MPSKKISPAMMRVKTWLGLRPISAFDEIELHSMCEGEGGELLQSSDAPEQAVVAYTVFLHLHEGGIETVQDFRFDATDEQGVKDGAYLQAEMLHEQLFDMLCASGMLRSIRSEAEQRSG